MDELADDTQAFARKIASSDECVERFEEVFQYGIDNEMTPEAHLDFVIETLTDEFIREDDAIQNDVRGYGELLEKTFEKEVAQKFLDEAQERQEFLDHLKSLAEEWTDE